MVGATGRAASAPAAPTTTHNKRLPPSRNFMIALVIVVVVSFLVGSRSNKAQSPSPCITNRAPTQTRDTGVAPAIVDLDINFFVQSTSSAATQLALATWLRPQLFLTNRSTNATEIDVTVLHAMVVPHRDVAWDVLTKVLEQANEPLHNRSLYPDLNVEQPQGVQLAPRWERPRTVHWEDIVIRHVCPIISPSGKKQQRTASSSGTPRHRGWFVLTQDDVLVSVRSVVELLDQSHLEDVSAVLVGSESQKEGGMAASFSAFFGGATAQSVIRLSSLGYPERFVILSASAASIVCSSNTRCNQATTKAAADLCLASLGLEIVRHRGIVDAKNHDAWNGVGASKFVSTVLAIARLPVLQWPYYTYFLNDYFTPPW